jgi:tetratricopeptide (TPR) repeat protein
MPLLCPFCRNPIEPPQTDQDDVVCSTCGSMVNLTELEPGPEGSPPASTVRSSLGSDPHATLSYRDGGLDQGSTLLEEKPVDDSPDPAPRSSIAHFELIQVVGNGAFGTVYKARDQRLDRIVALKVPRFGQIAGPDDSNRFFREARSAAQLRHPSIVRVHEVGDHQGIPYLVSDFVEGMTLANWLESRSPTIREAAALVAEVAEALEEAHKLGVIHRDVKPSNILLDASGRPHITDFGLAKRDAGEITMTLEGQVLGTPAYMSPEQARGEGHRVDGRSDIYSLGVILYELITGELPFHGNPRMLLYQVQHDEPKSVRSLNDRVPRDLETITHKAMAKEPARRYARAAELADDLRRFLGSEPIRARPVGRIEKFWRRCQRNPLPASLTAVLALVLVAGVASLAAMWRVAERERDRAEAINEFLTEKVLEQASPELNPRGAGITVAQLLDRAASRVHGDFQDQPAIEAAIRATVGKTYQALGDYQKAEEHLRAAVELNTRVYGPQNRATLEAVNHWTALLDETGRAAEAEPRLRQNLETCRRLLGNQDRLALEAADRLGSVLVHLGRLDEAEKLLKQNADDSARILGDDHPVTLRSVHTLCLLLKDRRRFEDAQRLAVRYEQGIRCSRGPNHPDNIVALSDLGLLELDQGRPAQAEPFLRKAVGAAERILGSEHPRTLEHRNHLLNTLKALGKSAEAAASGSGAATDRDRPQPTTLGASSTTPGR